MQIQTLINPVEVHLDLQASTLADALTLVAELAAPVVNLSATAIAQGLKDRESLGTTAIGGGFAIPHCKLRGIKGIVILLGRFREAVPFNGAQTEAVRFVFVVLSPPDHPALHLQALSQIARTLKSEEIRNQLLEVRDPEEAAAILNQASDGVTR